MKVDTRQIPAEGLILTEEFSPEELDLDTEIIKLCSALKARALVSKSYDAISVNLTLSATMLINCCRCLEEFNSSFNRQIEFNYAADKLNPLIDASTRLSINGERSRTIDLDQEIREEIILSYPIKALCKNDCMGLCPKCGLNLNEGGCNCGST